MATQAYYTWVQRGRPYTVAQPIKDLVDAAARAGVPCLGVLGSDDTRHLQAAVPQDHTPFPVNPWPVALPGYVVCAADFRDGPWSDRLLADAKAGRAPYVKYLNFRNNHYDIRSGWAPTYSSDPHLHVSCRSDFLGYRAGDPFTGQSNNTIVSSEDMALIGQGDDGQLYFCIGGFSHPIASTDVEDIKYLAKQGAFTLANNAAGNSVEWTGGGWIRKGWKPATFGAVYRDPSAPAPVQVDYASVQKAVKELLFNGLDSVA